MNWKTELEVNGEYNHSALFMLTVSRMRYLKEAQLKQVYDLVTGLWETKREAARREKTEANPTTNDLF